ncbi:RES family NAD+ phosphorylase [Silvibacterium acidisoli]|uniref:RES family NAD+ phosphorylase n=1 Tax=Acidobacteriaceae bacterium ZG23-2 TaxID=2883246 RepID=UPI00406CA66C
MSSFPPITEVRLRNTHRLIPSKYSDGVSVLSRLTDEAHTLEELMQLDGATNERLLGEEGLLPGIGVHELVFGVEYAHIVNAAFTHASPEGGRFNNGERGAWYAGLERDTSLAEVAFHKLRHLEEISWPDDEISMFDDYLADFTMRAHDLTQEGFAEEAKSFLEPDPVPACYAAPQRLAAELLAKQSNGILYPSARREAGRCIVCFRPALVYNVRRGKRLQMTLHAGEPFNSKSVREAMIPKA